ncbi:Helix-turn-helix (Modular protein) [Planktothrix tepida]|uniref:Helix-turn-helix (Modular protein) n=1 Tax=Planktothrix tepida PCC 9214 TaxID=671072 RepID=A0A1J1LUV8_9CYAN|nr:helix-turn-helix transcriptional regulator [Planktothrix tepida]CAD5990250.1 Helix-turn-helix (Modular protein) [Planktothrix tepida]CUR35644.1 Helix-turn-helix (modular protein) [Planktothrix tepida PCC 9214]
MKTQIKIKDMIKAKYEELRSEKKLTLCSLAKKAGMEKGQLSRIVNGETRNPGVDILSKIAKGFGITLDELNQKIYANLEEVVDLSVYVNDDNSCDLNGKVVQNEEYEITALIRNIDGQVTVEYQFRLGGNLNELTPEKIEEFQSRVFQLAQSNNHKYVYTTEGSIIIGFEGDLEGFKRIEALFKSGEMKELAGFPVLDVKLIAIDSYEEIVASASNNDPITALTTFLDSDDPVAVRVRERLENSPISEIVEQFNTAYQNNPATTLPYELADILAGSTPTAQNKNFRSANGGSEYSQLLSLARELAKKLAEIWGNAE